MTAPRHLDVIQFCRSKKMPDVDIGQNMRVHITGCSSWRGHLLRSLQEQRLTMTANFAKPILGSSLPHGFRKIRLELAREPGHPEGDNRISYTLVAPLDADARLDHDAWRHHREASRVVRQRPGEPDNSGHLIRTQHGEWAFHYDTHGGGSDEAGYRFADEKFTVGEYVSVVENGKARAYKVVSVEKL
jgi:hypothetical protein